MELITIGLIFIIIFLVYVSFFRQTSSHNDDCEEYPPLQSGVPIFGYAPFLRPNRYVALTKLQEKHGPIFRISIFNRKMLVIGSMDILREALVEKADVFTLRPIFRYIQTMTWSKGIIFTNGDDWLKHRRFVLKSLRDLGFAKTQSLEAIHEEVETLVDCVDSNGSNGINTKFIFSRMTNNVISSLVFGHKLGKHDKTFETLFEHVRKFMEIDSRIYENLPNYFPFIIDYPLLMKIYLRFAWREKAVTSIQNFIYGKLCEEAASFTTSSEPRSLMEALLLHRQALEDEGNFDHGFDNHSIVADVFDLFIAGTDTTAATLSWAMALLSANPDIQTTAREEIRKQIGFEKLPTMQDRPKLNYTSALLDEIARFGCIAPTALFHSTAEDTVLGGYSIPKDTIVIPNIYAIHRDPKLWKNPSNFDPSNFLDDNGDYQSSENLIPFSLGKRSCLGESLARMEMFIFLVATLQRYQVSLSAGDQVDAASLLEGDDGVVRHLKNHTIIFKRIDY